MQSIPGRDIVTTSRTPATAYLVLDSADRQQTASFGFLSGVSSSPWNNFKLQKPQSLIQSYARRIQPTEIRFPWFIPNICGYNRLITIQFNSQVENIQIPRGFYTPADLVNALNAAFDAAFGAGEVVIAYANFRYTLDSTGAAYIYPGNDTTIFDDKKYLFNPSLMKTLGFNTTQQGQLFGTNASMTGQITLSSYTDYVDICSERLNYYADVKDGTSRNIRGQDALLCRVYATDEVSIPYQSGVPQTCAPFMIHRQFKTPKNIRFDPESVTDYVDIEVFDMYGNLVDLPLFAQLDSLPAKEGYYPDFQITLTASES